MDRSNNYDDDFNIDHLGDEWTDIRNKYGNGLDTLNGCLDLIEMFVKVRLYNGEYSKICDRFQMILEESGERTAKPYRERLKKLEENCPEVSVAESENLMRKMEQGGGSQSLSKRALSRGSIIVGESESLR